MVKASRTLVVIDFVALKVAVKRYPYEGQKAYAYMRDFFENKINEETLFKALEQLNKKHEFMTDIATPERAATDIRQAVSMSVTAQFAAK
jgi:hypothetical protein